jgi:hypothetical protein
VGCSYKFQFETGTNFGTVGSGKAKDCYPRGTLIERHTS